MGPSDDGEKAVVVKDLERRFGSFMAVNRISFEVAKGEIFGFLGPNGAGKSTTIRMLCGILAPSGGTGTVAGFDIRPEAEKIKSHIGYMSQKFSLYEDLTVEENIDFYSGIYRIAEEKKKERKEWVIEMAGLKEHRSPARPFCPEAGSSVWPWAAPSSMSRPSSFSMNPPRAWIRSAAASSGT